MRVPTAERANAFPCRWIRERGVTLPGNPAPPALYPPGGGGAGEGRGVEGVRGGGRGDLGGGGHSRRGS